MLDRCTLFVFAAVAVAGACGGDAGDAAADAASAAGAGEPAKLAGITQAHNQVRAMIQTSPALEPLAWDDALAATAAAWVARCQDNDAPAGLIDHNPGRSEGHPYYVGENVFASTGNATGEAAVGSWAAEGADYNLSTNACAVDADCGHYTQLVWRTTLKLGCASGSCPRLRFSSTIVCDYGPGGNVNGQRPY